MTPSDAAMAPDRQRAPARRRALLALLTLLAVVIPAELLSALALWALRPRLDEPVRRVAAILAEQDTLMRRLVSGAGGPGRLDTLLGWSYRPAYVRAHHRLNAQGLRSARAYAASAPAGVLRVAAFGDSFVYGDEVLAESTWTARIEARHPDIEMLNYGVGGYGVDQALLSYGREGGTFGERVVLMGFAEDDITRVVNVYRRFRSITEHPVAKPRFVLEGDSLRLLPTPLGRPADFEPYLRDPRRIRELGRHDYWYSRLIYQNPLYDWSATVRLATAAWTRLHRRFGADRLLAGGEMRPETEAFRIQVKLFAAFADSARAAGAVPALLFFPGRESIRRARQGGRTAYAALREAACVEGLRCFDAVEAFRSAQPPDPELRSWFMPGAHYSESANDILAAWLGPRIQALRRSGR